MIEVNMDYPVIKADVNIPKTVATGDMTNYYTKDEVNQLVENVEVDLTGYATEEYVNQKVENIDIPEVDLTGYATEEYVKEEIGNVEVYIDDQIGNLATDIDNNYTTQKEVDQTVETFHTQIKEEFATKEDVDNIDLSNYYTKPEVDGLIEACDKIYVGDTEPTDDSLIWISQDGLNEPVASENYVEETINSAIGTVLEGEY